METSVLVTGGLGFVGSAVIAAVQEQHPEWRLSVLDLQEPIDPKHQVTYWARDITDQAAVEEAVSSLRPTAIIHTAGIVPELVDRYSRKERDKVFRINVDGTRNLLAAARGNYVEAFVWTGSCTAVTDDFSKQYPNIDESWPASNHSLIYGESKASTTIPSLHACIAKGETPFIIGDGLNMWDVTYVDNVADAHVLAVENLLSTKTAAGQAIFISNEQPLPFRDFCLAVWKEFGHYPPFEVKIPTALAAVAGYVAELATWFTGSASTLSRGSVKDACQVRYCNGVKAREVLGYKPRVGIEEGIRISCRVSGEYIGNA
ncbi:MAG: hypothetical protein Q9181_002224 [Wetmoreana brouardii]